MRVFKVLVILFLIAVIIVGGAGSYWLLVLRPRQLDQLADAARVPTGQATPDPALPDFENAAALRLEGKMEEAREALAGFINVHPDSPRRVEAETLLGSINVERAFSTAPGADKVLYTVRSGDTIDRVAHRYKVNPDLIFRASRLDNINLKIGQKLVIPTLDASTEIRLKDRRVVLFNHGQFFRSYVVREIRATVKRGLDLKVKVKERVATKDGIRVTFGTKEFDDSLRAVVFDQPGYTVFAVPPEGSVEKPPATTGIGLEASDAREYFTLVKVGDPVAITSD